MCNIKRLRPKVRRQEFVPGLCPLLRDVKHITLIQPAFRGEVTLLEVVVQIKL